MSPSETSDFRKVTEHYRIDEEQRVKDIIRKAITERCSSLEQVKSAIVTEIEKCSQRSNRIRDTVRKETTAWRFVVAMFLCILSIPQVISQLCCAVYKRLKQRRQQPIVSPKEERESLKQETPVESEKRVTKVLLSTIDHAFIDRKYIKCCLKVWQQEAENFLKELTDNQNHETIQDILYSLGTIQNLTKIPESLQQLEHYSLLMKNYGLISQNYQKTFLRKFKKEFSEQITTYSHFLEKELHFFRVFLDFLLESRSTEAIIAKLHLQRFCSNDVPFTKFLENIMNLEENDYGPELTVLQEVTKFLKQDKEPYLIKKFKKVINACLMPVKIQEKNLDGRLVVEATGKSIVISKILLQLETRLQDNCGIEEVRIVGADVLHIDADYDNEVWHGKNIVIFVKKIKIHDRVTWDISGKDSNHVYSDNGGTGEHGHGKQGAPGCNGESGGNALIQADEVENPENFTIISHGGKGSRGQDGGNGEDGEDGEGITTDEFNEKFPSVVKLLASSSEKTRLLLKTVNNILSSTITAHDDWCANNNRFIDADTSQGNKITFSFCASSISTRFQAFLLYCGSSGQQGGHGGKCGVGGKGGYNGEVITNSPHIVVIANEGENGEHGKGGLYGKHGKNGWDIGYVDYQTWREPQFYGRDQQSRLRLEYHDHDGGQKNRVWCPYSNRYASITPVRVEHRIEKKYMERKNIGQNDEQQCRAQATKKKTISRNKISNDYIHHFSSLGRSALDNFGNINLQAIEMMTENTEQQEKVTTKVNVKHHIRSTHQNIGTLCNKTNNIIFSSHSGQTNQHCAESLLGKLQNDSLSNQLELQSPEPSPSEPVEELCVLDTTNYNFLPSQEYNPCTENYQLPDSKQVLNEKYRFIIFQKIAKQLPSNHNVAVNPKLTPVRAARYLVAATENDNNISHHTLGTLNQYFYQNRKTQSKGIFKFLKKESKRTAKEALQRSVGTFILEVGKFDQIDQDIKKYYTECTEYLKKQERSQKIFLEPFLVELQQHEHIFALWIRSSNNPSIKYELLKEIKEHKFLNALYNRVDTQLKQVYNWNSCCNNKGILKKYNRHIREKGPLSKSYRELLAYIFDVNIRLYVEDPDNQLHLLDNHKPFSTKVIHILQRDDKFDHLKIDENFSKLEKQREKHDIFLMQIFARTASFKQKKEFDDYCQNQRFLSNRNALENGYCFDEEVDIINISEDHFPSSEEGRQMMKCLEKIEPQYIGHRGILYNIMRCFSNDGRLVSLQELSCLVNSILTSVIEDKKDLNIFCWIVAAYPQKCWIDELVLLQFENYFKKPLAEKSKWRKYLSKLENKEILLSLRLKLKEHRSSSSISTQCIEDILNLLSNIPNEVCSLKHLNITEWPYALKERYWTYKLSQLTNWQGGDELSEASYYCLSVENTFGTSVVEKFLEILKHKELSPDTLTDILTNFHNEKWNLSDKELTELAECDITEWMEKMWQKFSANKKERDMTELVEIIRGNANTSEKICDKLPTVEKSINSNCKQEASTDVGVGYDLEKCRKAYEEWSSTYRSNTSERNQCIDEARTEILAMIDRVIELTRGFKLRDAQKLAVLAILTNERNTLAQVATGEGKSLIVVAASIIMIVLCRHKVDIITSSSVLAKRDANSNKDIYNLFNINVSHNCNEDIEKRREAYSSSQVVYGDLSNFQRDYLLDRFYGKNILGDRNFEIVFVDEVDSMLLDKGNNMLYLSHDIAGLDKLESIYIYIWQWVNRPAQSHEEIFSAFDTEAIKHIVLNDLYGLITKEDLKKLGSELDDQQVKIMWRCLIAAEILNDQGKLMKENIDDDELEMAISSELSSYKDRVRYLIQECIGREKFIQVPNYLKPFIEQHLESWINNAIMALVMKEGHDYIIDVDRTGTSPDLNPNITILDRDTGTDQANSQWDEALHQFLQLKHGCKLSLQSLKAVFISNVSYLKLYGHLYGLTGTLGSQRERELLKEVHSVDFVTIPTARCKQFDEQVPIPCINRKQWIANVFNEAMEFTNKKKRSVLIICETIDDVETLHQNFVAKGMNDVHTYTRDYEEFEIAQGNKELKQGEIIIATNLSGRGTDIKITEELREAGGLHVCLSYLPNNSRIEQQAFGRAARSGDKGSGRLIFMGPDRQEYPNLKILDLKTQRDHEELHRISDIKAYYETQIIAEEHCFKQFQNQYERLKKDLTDNNIRTEIKKILLQSCLDKWASWLDRNSKCIKNVTDDQSKINFETSLTGFISELKNLKCRDNQNWLIWVEEQPIQMIKLGKYFCQVKEYDDAIQLFDKVIEQEPCFCEAAHYYKAFALVKKIDWETKPVDKKTLQELKRGLWEAARIFDEHRNSCICAASIIGNIKQYDRKSIVQIDTYADQQESKGHLYDMFSQSINNIFGQLVTPESFEDDDLNGELSEILYEDLLRNGILTMPKVKNTFAEERVNKISFDYGIPDGELNTFLSKFKGKEINEKTFLNTLKDSIKLPSREEFWKLLIQENVLTHEVKYIIIRVDRMKQVNPALLQLLSDKINRMELEQQTLEFTDPNGILLNAELVEREQEDCIVLKKNAFKAVINNDKKKYEFLKKKGIFSYNKKAHIDSNKIPFTTPSRHDSITLRDFSRENIAENDAKKILFGLVEQKVLRQENSVNGIYRLLIPYNEIDRIQLPAYPVYEHAVRALLSLSFIYRVALENIKKQLKDKHFPIYLQLPSKRYHKLIYELLDQRIIRPVKVSAKIDDLKKKLGDMYSCTITRDDLKQILHQRGPISIESDTDEFYNHLVENGWLSVEQHEPPAGIITSQPHDNSVKKYTINDSSRGKTLPFDEDIVSKIAQVLDDRLQLAKDGTIEHIVRTLEQSRGLLNTFEVPDNNLKSLTDCSGRGEFKNIEEVNIFILNGLDQLLQFEERKWTKKMLLNTGIVAAIGVCEIAIGATIHLSLLSHGVCELVDSTPFVREGLGDIYYAARAFESGYFSWQGYVQHKLQSLIFTALYTVGGIIKAQFHNGVARPQLELREEMAGNSHNLMMGTVGTTIAREARNFTIWKSVEDGIAFGLAQTGFVAIFEHQLQKLCDRISSVILSDIETRVEKHNSSKTLEEIYQMLGNDEAKKLMNDLTQECVTEPSFMADLPIIAAPIARSVVRKIKKATAKMNQIKSNTHTSPNQIISTVLAQVAPAEDLVPTGDILRMTDNNLDNLIEKITDELGNSQCEQNAERNAEDQREGAVQDFESFKKEVLTQWKSVFLDKAGQVIKRDIVSPIIDEGIDHLIRYHKKTVKREYRSYKGGRDNERFEELKRQYQKLEPIAHESHSDDLNEVEICAVNEYHENLLKLMHKTRNYKLFAAMVRENIPMDVTCLDVCTRVIRKMLGIKGLTIVIRGKSGIEPKFPSSMAGAVEDQIIELQLIDHHFRLHGSAIVDSNENGESTKNCLYEALLDQLHPLIDMTRESFRAEVANHIEQDPDVQNHIKRDWRELSTSHHAIGSRHDIKMSTEELWTSIIDEKVKLLQNNMSNYTCDRDGQLEEYLDECAEVLENGCPDEPVTAPETVEGFILLDNSQGEGTAITESLAKVDKIMTRKATEKLPAEYELSDPVKLRARQGKSKRPDGLESRNVALRKIGSHYEAIKTAEQQIRGLNFEFSIPLRKRQLPNGRSKSLERPL